MKILQVGQEELPQAARIYRESWQVSHQEIGSPAFLRSRDDGVCQAYLTKLLEEGKVLYWIWDPEPVGLVAVGGGQKITAPLRCMKSMDSGVWEASSLSHGISAAGGVSNPVGPAKPLLGDGDGDINMEKMQ